MVTCNSPDNFGSFKRIYGNVLPPGQMCYMLCFERHNTYYYTDSKLKFIFLSGSYQARRISGNYRAQIHQIKQIKARN